MRKRNFLWIAMSLLILSLMNVAITDAEESSDWMEPLPAYLPNPIQPWLSSDEVTLMYGVPLKVVVNDPNPSKLRSASV